MAKSIEMIYIDSDLAPIKVGTYKEKKVVVKKWLDSNYEFVSKMTFDRFKKSIPEIIIDNDHDHAYIEFITFDHTDYTQWQKSGALCLYTLCKKLVTEQSIDDFMSRVNKESLANMVMFGIICGYGDWATRW